MGSYASSSTTCWPVLAKTRVLREHIVAVSWVDGVDLNAWMFHQRWALAYCGHSMDYVSLEAETLASRTVWRAEFVEPFTQQFPLLDFRRPGR